MVLGGGEMDMEIEDDKGPTSSNDQQQNGDLWSGWSGGGGGEWPPTQTGMGWGWGWPVDSYSQGAAASAPDLPPHQYNTNNGEYGWPMVSGGGSGPGGEYAMGDPREQRPRDFPVGGLDQDRPSAAKEADFQLDAAQRKKLPAWIREGLEKMEREKQRKLEKERQMSEKEEMLKRKREEEARARRILEEDLANDGKPRIPRKSKFDSDSEPSDRSRSASPETTTPGLGLVRKRRSRFEPQGGGRGGQADHPKEKDGVVEEEEEEEEEREKSEKNLFVCVLCE